MGATCCYAAQESDGPRHESVPAARGMDEGMCTKLQNTKGIEAGKPGMGLQRIEVLVIRSGLDDKLGMDVKHTQGVLEVVNISPDGAVHRANDLLQLSEGLQIGDMIYMINGVDHHLLMVVECKDKQQLRIKAFRPH